MVRTKPINPFNMVLLVVGILFVVTACGYSVMTVKAAQPTEASQAVEASHASQSGARLLELLDKHGFTALMVELGILAAATFAAIATDNYWSRRVVCEQESTSGKTENNG